LIRYLYKNLIKFIYKLLHRLNYRLINRNGIKYLLDLRKPISVSIFLRGYWEKHVVHFLKKNLKLKDFVIECGSNIGAHSFIIAKLVGPEGKVFCFEPTDYANTLLKTNLLLNSFENIIIEKKILSNNENKLAIKYMVSDLNHEDSFNIPEDLSNIPITSIDQYQYNFDKLSLIKIDVDGYDYKVLEGALNTIKKYKPIVIIELCEFTLNRAGDSIQDILNFFSLIDYEGFYISKNKKILSFEEVLRLSSNGKSHVDTYFKPKCIV
jgi:FkbM family methyltransferase